MPHRGAARAGAARLVVEDQILIGLSIEAYLNYIGIDVGASFRPEADALRWLAHERPDFAIVDYALSDGPCVALAAALRRTGIPFVVYSGPTVADDMAGPLRGAVWIDKPAPRADDPLRARADPSAASSRSCVAGTHGRRGLLERQN